MTHPPHAAHPNLPPHAAPDSLLALHHAFVSGQRSARDLALDALARADALNPRLNALVDTLRDDALRQADALDARRARNEPLGSLAGVPLIIKDNLCLAWGRTTCASRFLETYRSPFTATSVQRLLDADAIIIAKANLDEFAMGGSGEHSALGPTRNPWDLARVPGGSSSGSAAVVAAGIVPGALGSDTGGSIRQPAAFCGLLGIKPTYGRVSRRGLVAFASSLDQVGPLARSTHDLAALLAPLCAHDPLDSTSLDIAPEPFASELDTPIPDLVLGLPRQARNPANHPSVTLALDQTLEIFRRLGAKIVDIDLPNADHAIAAYYIIATAEASSNLARFDGVRYGRRAAPRPTDPPADALFNLYARSRAEGFGPEVQRRIMLGTHVLSSGYYDAYYLTALKVRRLIKQDYDRAFAQGCHAVLMPTAPSPAFRVGEKVGDPMALYLEDLYTVGVNLAGLPALAFPAGFATIDSAPLPVGLQLIGPPLAERALLRIARAHERATDWHTRRAPIAHPVADPVA
jgi:aspartyl-tRNA(Asn)/glutamyl-tRNA(Gln) amidotransferase subunit A